MSTSISGIAWKAIVAVLVMATVGLTLWDNTPRERWIDEALGHDGHVLTVNRTVELTFSGGELSSAFQRSPNKYSLEFASPIDGRHIAWQGEKYVHPILLDIVDGTPWLIVFSSAIYSSPELYGCPELPYAFLKFDASLSRWTPVAASEAPEVLRQANLSFGWDKYFMDKKRRRTPTDIEKGFHLAETSTSKSFSPRIPRTYEEWAYQFKKQHATSRRPNDCRPPLEQPVDVIFPKGQTTPSIPVQLEVLEVKTFDPEWEINENPNARQSVWSTYAWDKDRAKACDAFTRPADQQDQRLASWRTFVGDPSGKRMFSSTHMLCDSDAIWFFNYVAELGRMTIVKTTADGNILYRASFPKPDEVGGYLGAIMSPTLHAKDGYLYFEWRNSNQSGGDRRVKRSMKVRFAEPAVVVPSS